MSETLIWKELKPYLEDWGQCSRHEDKYLSGVPDISYGIDRVNGWIESKFISKWPKDYRKEVKLRKFTDIQKEWCYKRHLSGGNCYIMLMVGKDVKTREMLLFEGSYAWELGNVNKVKLIESCIWRSRGVGPGSFSLPRLKYYLASRSL